MSTATGPTSDQMHLGWAAFVSLEVLVVAVTLALDFTVAGLVMACLVGMSLALHRRGLRPRRSPD